jgi:glycosyltransferase involved in cell wall biosynthesis
VRTALLTTSLPNPGSGSGASIALALIASSLAERGHEVSICPIVYPEYTTPDGAGHERQIEHARTLGYEVAPVISDAWRPRAPIEGLHAKLKRAWRPEFDELYPQVRDAARARAVLDELEPEAVLVYGFAALAASVALTVPRFAATSDPPHLALWGRTWRRWRNERRPLRAVREAIGIQSTLRAHPGLALQLLRECEAVGAFGFHHAEWLRRLGVDCGYYRTPIADPGVSAPQTPGGDPPTILLIGHLHGTATLDGLSVFRKMLPHLERVLGADGFKVRIVGGYEPPPELAPLFAHPAVDFAGFVADVEAEFRRADVLLVPVSIKLGVRVRVLTGFSYGNCIVTHKANSYGIPELSHGENALLGSSAEQLAEEVVRALGDPDLRARLGAGARVTYEAFFTPEAAGGRLGETLERIAARPRETAGRG